MPDQLMHFPLNFLATGTVIRECSSRDSIASGLYTQDGKNGYVPSKRPYVPINAHHTRVFTTLPQLTRNYTSNTPLFHRTYTCTLAHAFTSVLSSTGPEALLSNRCPASAICCKFRLTRGSSLPVSMSAVSCSAS